MKEYLESLIVEQINRALTLKELIQYPIQYPELTGLAERCTSILDNQIELLKELRAVLQRREENDIRDIFRDIRICARYISSVEYFGIPALRYQTPEIGFLNKIMFKIHQEVKLPFPPPSVCCAAGQYYYSHLFTSVIFVPIAEWKFLLHMPDLYHELGHYVLENIESELRLKAIKDNYHLAFSKVTDYYRKLMKEKKREFGPEETMIIIQRIHTLWKYWIQEFFCDLFALYTVGPAYAWSHLHLTMKRSDNIYQLNILQKQTHPADEARMRILLQGLRNLGLSKEADQIQAKWFETRIFWGPPTTEYQYAYPDVLLNEISSLTLKGLEASGFSLITIENLIDQKNNEFRSMLNKAWEIFWKTNPEEFRKWEEEQLKKLSSACNASIIKLSTTNNKKL
jgi:hypothetical protein